MYSVRYKTIWLATPKSFYHKSRAKLSNGMKIYEFRSWRMPMNLAWRVMREGYAMCEETAAAWALDHCPEGGIVRGVSRDYIHTFPLDSTLEDVLNYTKAKLIRNEVTTISSNAYAEPLCLRKNSSGCREFESYQNWYNSASACVH